MEQPSVSKHCGYLLEVGLVNVRRDGRRQCSIERCPEAIRPLSRVDGNVRALLASSIKPRKERAERKKHPSTIRAGFHFRRKDDLDSNKN